MDRPPTRLGYRATSDDNRAAPSGVFTGAGGLAAAVVACGWIGITTTTQLRSRLPFDVSRDIWFLAIPISMSALILGLRATREGQSAVGSRLGNWALLLTCALWTIVVAAAAMRS